MRFPLWFWKVLSHAQAASAGLALVAICTLASGALASRLDFCGWSCDRHRPLPGISLADLVEGQGFESLDGDLVFSDFQVKVDGHAIHDLAFYRVLPTEDGFKLFSPLLVMFGRDASLTLDYQLETAREDLIVESVSLSFIGFAFGDAKAWVEASLSASGGDPLGALSVARTGPFNSGGSSDREDLEDLLSALDVSELIGLETGWKHCFGGLAGVLMVDHSFEVAIPEPATILLLALGLGGLGVRGRRRER